MAAVRTASGFVHPPERCCGLPWTFATRLPSLASGLALAVKPGVLAVVPMFVSVSGNDIGRSCFRIPTLNCYGQSTDVHRRMSLSRVPCKCDYAPATLMRHMTQLWWII
jgi:hypothetical protein